MDHPPRSHFWFAVFASVPLLAGCRAKVASLEATPRRLAIYGTEQSKEITVRALNGKGSAAAEIPPLTWKSSNPDVVEISGNGHVVPKAPGHAIVTAQSGNLSTSVSVDVVDLSKIELAPALLRLVGPKGTAAKYELTGKNAAKKPAAVPPVSWLLSNPAVVSISPDGTVTSLSPGKTLITAKVGDLVAESELEVDIRTVSRIELRPETAILHVGESQKLSVIAYDENGLPIADAGAQLSSNVPDIVRVLGDGTITGLTSGTAVVTAAIGDRIAQATVLVD
jgi:uncharacterized protein YjdB